MGLFVPDISFAEKILRSVVVYLFLLVAFRLTGKRQVGQLTPFDLVLLLLISNVVQNAVIGNDNSLGGGLLGAATILLLNLLVVEITYRSKRLRRLLEATPTILVHNGKILHQNLARERVTMDDLLAALRRNGVADVAHVRIAMLFLQGARDALAQAELISSVADRLRDRASLHLIAEADHSFHVPARSGRTDAEVRSGLLDRLAAWTFDIISRTQPG